MTETIPIQSRKQPIINIWWNTFMFLEIIFYFTPLTLISLFNNELILSLLHPWGYLARILFGADNPIAIESAEDSAFAYFQGISSLIIFGIIALIWTLIEHTQTKFTLSIIDQIFRWIWRNMLRIDLAILLISYGMVKTIPTQMHTPWPTELAKHIGDQTNMDFFWNFIGFSPQFEIIIGIIELMGGVLLLIPRFITLGGYLSLAIMLPTVMIVFCYDVNVKILPSLICLGEIILLWPSLIGLCQHLIFQQDLKAKNSNRIISTDKIWLKRISIMLYLALSILVIIKSSEDTWKIYQDGQLDPHIPVNGRWIITSVQSQDSTLAPLMLQDWIAFDITAIHQGGTSSGGVSSFLIEFKQGNSQEIFAVKYTQQDIILSTQFSGFLPYNLDLHYTLTGNTLTLNSVNPHTHQPNLHIIAVKSPPWAHHPGEFHWY